MRAIRARRYGTPDVLTLEEVDRPTPDGDQVLVEVCAAGLNPSDGTAWKARSRCSDRHTATPSRPITHSARIVAVGENVTRFAVGDAVFGAARGSLAEYAIAAEKNLVHRPENVSFVQAAAIPTGGLTALQGLRDQGRLISGQRVLIIGASGGVGVAAVQIARSFGAHVTAVCSTTNTDMVRGLGADDVIDYTAQDWDGTGPYDLILDMVGDRPLDAYVGNLTDEGRVVSVGALGTDTTEFLTKLGAFKASEHGERIHSFTARFTTEDLATLAQLMSSGALTSVIDRTYPFDETPSAMAMLGSRRTRGKVVVSVRENDL